MIPRQPYFKYYKNRNHLDGKTVAVESSLEMLVEARGLQRPVLLLRREEQAGSVGEGQRLSGSVKESLLTPAVRRSGWVTTTDEHDTHM